MPTVEEARQPPSVILGAKHSPYNLKSQERDCKKQKQAVELRISAKYSMRDRRPNSLADLSTANSFAFLPLVDTKLGLENRCHSGTARNL